MSRVKFGLLAGTLLAGLGGAAIAQQQTYDPAQLPTIKGKVAQYTLTPRADVDGFILDDGTEVHVSPRLSTQLVFAVRPGDAVTIHGLRAKAVPMVAAMSVTNDATNATVVSSGERHEHGPAASPVDATGVVKAQLHGPQGELNGVLLGDGTMVRLPPPEAAKLGDKLAVGKTVYVRGEGVSNPLGKLVMARAIGTNATDATEIATPRPHGGPGGMMRGMMQGFHHEGGPMGGPRGDAPPPPRP